MRSVTMRSVLLALVVPLVLLLGGKPTAAADRQLLSTTFTHVAIQGYDTVAYFTDGKAIMGSSEYEYVWGDAKWWFASAEHRTMFIADPDRYMPQFGGFCAAAMAMVDGDLVPADPENWAIVNGKLYMTTSGKKHFSDWLKNAPANIAKANENWPHIYSRWSAENQ